MLSSGSPARRSLPGTCPPGRDAGRGCPGLHPAGRGGAPPERHAAPPPRGLWLGARSRLWGAVAAPAAGGLCRRPQRPESEGEGRPPPDPGAGTPPGARRRPRASPAADSAPAPQLLDLQAGGQARPSARPPACCLPPRGKPFTLRRAWPAGSGVSPQPARRQASGPSISRRRCPGPGPGWGRGPRLRLAAWPWRRLWLLERAVVPEQSQPAAGVRWWWCWGGGGWRPFRSGSPHPPCAASKGRNSSHGSAVGSHTPAPAGQSPRWPRDAAGRIQG